MRLRSFDDSLAKTASFAVIHLAIAVTLGWLFTGAFVLAGMLALVEPLVNTVVGHRIERLGIGRGRSRRQQAAMQSAVLGLSHLVVAIGVGLLLGGNWIAMTAYAIVEPMANAVAHYFFNLWWHARRACTVAT
jgi:uncharacterized membrane protein